jgi:hypothetical protein
VISPLSLVSISVNSEIVIPSSRTRLPRTPSAKGAAIASIRATAVELSPEFRPSVSATELLVAAKDLRKQAPAHVEQLRSSRASGCGMPDIDWVQRISGRVFYEIKISRSSPGLLVLLAMPLTMAANAGRSPRETASSDPPMRVAMLASVL